ncbi:MAG: efflux RND transporter periplasmic adaptor subunit [bacterium]
MKRVFLWSALFGVIILMGWWMSQRFISSRDDTHTARKVPAVAVEVAPIFRGTIRNVQRFTGTLVPKAHFVVAPKIGGRLERLMVNIGDTVERDQLIAVVEDAEYVQEVEEARAELAVAKASLEEQTSALDSIQREFNRILALREKKIASESELDALQAELEVGKAKHKLAMAQVSQKEAALKAAQVRLSYTRIRASWEDGDGNRVVGERFVDEGAMLSANAPIVSIYDISSLTAVIFVIERDYPKVQVGQDALLTTDAYPQRTFAGRIIRVAPVLKEASRQARVEIEVSNPAWLLKPGMFARVELEFAHHEDVTLVPVTSIARRGEQQGVFLVDAEGMKAVFTPVSLGIVNGETAEVLSPPLSGRVVTMGQHLLEDGSPLILPENTPDERE